MDGQAIVKSDSRTTVLLVLWCLLPCFAIYVGMYIIKSAAWSFALYHVLCLAPAIYWGRKYWLPTWILPKQSHLVWITFAAIAFSAVTVATYELLGKLVLSDQTAINLLKQQGYSKEIFIPISFYAVVVNPIVEEIFWRGIVFNYLDQLQMQRKIFPLVFSSAAYALFHYFIFRLVMYPVWAEFGTLLLAIYGAGLALLYRRTGSIVTTALAHGLLTDLAAIALIIDLFRKYPHSGLY